MHEFRYTGEWFGGYDGHGVIASGNLSTIISRPTSMNGPGKGTNPDELLISAAGSCFLMSLSYILQQEGIDAVKVAIRSVGKFEAVQTGMRFRELIHSADILLESEMDNQEAVIADVLHKADERCMVSNALKDNVSISIISTVRVQSR